MSENNILAITIDEIIRDYNEQFDNVYRKKFIKNQGLVNMTENFEALPEEEEEEEFKRLEAKANALIHLPITTNSLLNHYEFDSLKAFEDFTTQHTLELYGSAGQVPFAMQEANKIAFNKTELGLKDVILICPGDNQKIISTLHFLVKSSCKIGHIIFIDDFTKIWDYADIVITDRPEILDSAKANHKTIKIIKDYNINSKSNIELSSLNKINLRSFENFIKNNKYE